MVESPKPEDKEMSCWTPEEAKNFLATAQEGLSQTVHLAIYTGLRRGELLGLRWQDVDLDDQELSIRQTLVKATDGSLHFQKPKTASGRRVVDIPPTAADVLKNHRKNQAELKLKNEGIWEYDDLVFTTDSGNHLFPRNVLRAFYRIIEKAELPKITFHDMRHTNATMRLKEGIHPKIVSERLGHSSVRITLDTYSHALPSLQKEAAEKLDKSLSETPRESTGQKFSRYYVIFYGFEGDCHKK